MEEILRITGRTIITTPFFFPHTGDNDFIILHSPAHSNQCFPLCIWSNMEQLCLVQIYLSTFFAFHVYQVSLKKTQVSDNPHASYAIR